MRFNAQNMQESMTYYQPSSPALRLTSDVREEIVEQATDHHRLSVRNTRVDDLCPFLGGRVTQAAGDVQHIKHGPLTLDGRHVDLQSVH